MMKVVNDKVQIEEMGRDEDLRSGCWKFLSPGLWGEDANALKILAPDRDTMSALVEALHGETIKIGATEYCIEATNDALLEEEAKNVCGRAVRRNHAA